VIRRIPEIQFAKVRLIREKGLYNPVMTVKTLKMILFKARSELRLWLDKQTENGKTTGFVPTMGALHSGHIHLVEVSKQTADLTICSIFVNPVQFNDPEDFKKYPVSTEKDIELLEKAGTDVLFLPSVAEVYPDATNLEHYDLGDLETVFEGRFRPGHFQGVCQVMNRLLKAVQPDHLFMGQKDYQQCKVVQRLLHLMQIPLQFHQVATIRDIDGLAQSSRNRRLNPDQRKNANAIYKTLSFLKENFSAGDLKALISSAENILDSAHFRIDYVSIADAKDLKPIPVWDGKEPAVGLIAAFQGDVRLIDNMLLN
jgi:pantoate--beta-alanine ligase